MVHGMVVVVVVMTWFSSGLPFTRGKICKTNQASHTAFRGFGGPQGMVISESIMDHLARAVGIEGETFREMNFYKEGDEVHFGQKLERWNVPQSWNEMKVVGNVADRKAAVEAFNKENRWRKRGLAVTPTKFGINFTAKFMNQVRDGILVAAPLGQFLR